MSYCCFHCAEIIENTILCKRFTQLVTKDRMLVIQHFYFDTFGTINLLNSTDAINLSI